MSKYYAIRIGRCPGVYTSWDEARKQVNGFAGAIHKRFSTLAEAKAFAGTKEEDFVKSSTIVPTKASANTSAKAFVDTLAPSKDEVVTTSGEEEISSSPKRQIYTDGSGNGGWAYVVVTTDTILYEKSGRLPGMITNNRAELYAILQALRDHPNEDLIFRPDSKYAIKAVTEWCQVWQLNGWRTSKKTPVENRDLIEAILEEQQGRHITYEHVYGHSGNKYNHRCDRLAALQSQQ